MSLGTRIAELRNDFGCNQREFARILNVRQGTVSAWETEKSGPTDGNLLRLAFLAEEPRAVAAWLRDGGEKPAIRKHSPEPRQANGTRTPMLLADVDRWLERQRLSIDLLREMEQLVIEDHEAVTPVLKALKAAMSAAVGSRQAMEGMRLTLES